MPKVNTPSWFSAYGEQSYVDSADGSFFWSQIGNGPDGFFVYVFRTLPNGVTERVNYSPMLHHGTLFVSPKGLTLFGFVQYSGQNKDNYNIPIQGYVSFNASNVSQLPVTIVTPVNGVDDVARGTITEVRNVANTANDRVKALTNQVQDHLTKHPSSQVVTNAGLTESQVADIVWSKAADRLYVEVIAAMNDDTHYLAKLVKQYAGNTVVDIEKLTRAIVAELQRKVIAP